MAGSFQQAAAFTLLFHFFLPFLVLIFHLLTGFGLSYTGFVHEHGKRERQRETEVCDDSTYIRIYATARRMEMVNRAHARGWTSLRLLFRAFIGTVFPVTSFSARTAWPGALLTMRNTSTGAAARSRILC